MSCTLALAIQSRDTGQRIPFLQLSTDHNTDIHYQVKHRWCICLGHLANNTRSLQENLARSATRVRTIVAVFVTKPKAMSTVELHMRETQ